MFGLFQYPNAIMDFLPMVVPVLALTPIIFNRSTGKGETSILIVSSVIAAYVSIKFATRTPFLVLISAILVLLAGSLILKFELSRIKIFLTAMLSIPTAIYIFSQGWLDAIINRLLTKNNFSSGRTVLWNNAIENIYRNPFGGGRSDMLPVKYAHNGVLDFAIDYGVIPASLLIIFEIIILVACLRHVWIFNARPSKNFTTLVLLHVGSVAYLAVSPYIAFFFVYYSASSLALASYIRATSRASKADELTSI